MTVRVLALVALLVAISPVLAQQAQEKQSFTTTASPEAQKLLVPQLTEVQKLTIQNLAQRIELAQLRAQQAQRDFETARDEITKLIQSLQVPGYDLDLQALVYTLKKPVVAKEPE